MASKGEQTRQKIVAAAAPIFNQRGFEGSSLNDLMEATGLKKGGIYRHFSSKEELAAEAFDYAWKEALEARLRELDAIANSVDRLKQLISNFVERRSSVPGGCPVLNTAIDADDGNPVLRARALGGLQQWRKLLQSIIGNGIRRKEIRRDVSPKRLANMIIASLEGAMMISRLEKSMDALHCIQSYLHHYLESEVRMNGARKSRKRP